jgi:hypothetical protein
MILIINGQQFQLGDPFAMGGEGELYHLGAIDVAKVYNDDVKKDPRWTMRRQKVLALCNSYNAFAMRHSDVAIAFPKHAAHEGVISFESLIGFSMQRYDCPEIAELGFNDKRQKFDEVAGFAFDDEKAVAFVYALFGMIDQLHQSRIILGDINPRNFLYDVSASKPVIIDLDAAQVGGFSCWARSQGFEDPRIQQGGKNLSGAYTFDFGSDIFGAAMVCFQFLVGYPPFNVATTPPRPALKKKDLGLSFVRALELGKESFLDHGVKYFESEDNERVVRRILHLKHIDKRLYEFFVSLFVRGERDNLLLSFPVTDPRHPANHFFVSSGMAELVRREKEKQRAKLVVARKPSPTQGAGHEVGAAAIVQHEPLAVAGRRALSSRADPAGFAAFVRQFDLRIGE